MESPSNSGQFNHLIVAASAKLVGWLFVAVRNSFRFCQVLTASFSAFTVSATVGGHLEDGAVALGDDNSISVTDLAMKWDTLKVELDVDIPEICVGGFCIIGIPFDGCALRAPRFCLFSDNPDIRIPLDLSGLATSRVTAQLRPLTK